ncbi:hypothetical protein C8J56DRAFT_882100 [Mycena floridula]|nr:hypothetical protein C8J56DRAFT_882100 [Mycena floridula]
MGIQVLRETHAKCQRFDADISTGMSENPAVPAGYLQSRPSLELVLDSISVHSFLGFESRSSLINSALLRSSPTTSPELPRLNFGSPNIWDVTPGSAHLLGIKEQLRSHEKIGNQNDNLAAAGDMIMIQTLMILTNLFRSDNRSLDPIIHPRTQKNNSKLNLKFPKKYEKKYSTSHRQIGPSMITTANDELVALRWLETKVFITWTASGMVRTAPTTYIARLSGKSGREA